MHVRVRRLEISLRCCSVGTIRFILSLTWASHSYLLLGAGVTSSYTLLAFYVGSWDWAHVSMLTSKALY